ncbi:MAG: response regulator [Opitutaceae bacterium]
MPASRKGAFKVLLVDDDSLVRTTCARSLNACGYTVTMAADGEGAWERLRSEVFDLLITDHMMPRLTGLNLIKRLRDANMTVPSILISGNPPTDESDLLLLIQPGRFLQKPFNLASLLDVVNGLLKIPD